MDITQGFRRLVRQALGLRADDDLPSIDRLALYRCEVKVASSDGQTLDVQPEDKRVPAHQGVPVRVGIPGAVAVVQPGAIVLLGWERGDPERPYAEPSWENGATVSKLILNATIAHLGGETGSEFVALANKVKAWFDAFNAAVNAWTPVPTDGGAALKAALATLVAGVPTTNVAATQVKAK